MERQRPDTRARSRDGDEVEIAYEAGRALARVRTGIFQLGRLARPALVATLGGVGRSVRDSIEALRGRIRRRRARLTAPAPPRWLPPSAGGRPPRPRRRGARVLAGGFAGLTLIAAASFGGWVWAVQDVPVQQVIEGPSHAAIVLEDQDGEVFARRGPLMGPPVAREDLPGHLVAAVLAIEDRRFDRHFGIDPIAVTRAFMSNWRAGHIVEGGSTITQQLAKLSLGEGERTWERKLQESALALWLETRLTKDEILARYLNNIYMGSGVVGISGAARFYFGKEVGELTLAESAMLAGMIHAPSRRNPLHHWEAARARANLVLDAMAADGAIDSAEALAAKASPAEPDPFTHAGGGGSWFADWMLAEIADRIGSFESAIRVRTTLHPDIQRIAEEVVERILAEEGEAHRFSQAALVAMRPDGAVVAMVGGQSYADSQFNRATQALRQPGSAFKTFVYLAALRGGFRPESVLRDEPIDIGGWRPANYGGRFHGRVSLADAFTHSLNAATVRLGHEVGLDNVIGAARDLGIDAELSPNPSLPLGTSEVTLLDLTAAYASIRAGHMPVKPWGMIELGREGEEDRFPVGPARTRLQPLDHRSEMVQLLERVVQHGTGRRAAIDGFVAGKTGTSQGFRDAWFVGFTDSLVVGVWVGNDDSAPMARGLVGGTVPAAIWRDFVTQAAPLTGKAPLIAMAPSERSLTDFPTGLPLSDEPAESFAVHIPDEMAAEGRWRGAGDSAQRWAGRMACDVDACARRYRSFRASDCTFQPYRGSRQVCPIAPQAPGGQAFAARPQEHGPAPGAAAPRQSAQCDIAACDRRYRSFRASDCTYQPYRGPRRLCPIPQRGAAGAARPQASPSAMPPGFQCNVQACARAYRSFRLADCTYQPFRGPRRLCTR